ncbi:flavoprotein [Paraburkholderia unamae]|uniref:Flavoprotein n=1 Tax=Paraburkholderia unamae TaxID=219649 RepID=A0ABX5KI16_9BURK|nr:flavoprotein [Paraburkholderia unamae]PVX77051.1 flavoprotein [Paraburkholderia unamae]CAG9261562.1 Flavoprotein [Paraburkholderia unamae]
MTQAPARRLTDFRADARFAWCVTGSGHLLEESLALALALPCVDLFLSAAAEEVLPLYGWTLAKLRNHFRVLRDNSASGVPVGMLYQGIYHTVVIAPATSNTVAKCAFGISDTLPTNMYAQAGKQCIPGIVFACDTEPTVVTHSPNEWVELRPRRIELDNVERLSRFEHTTLVRSLDELKTALDARLSTFGLAWITSSS